MKCILFFQSRTILLILLCFFSFIKFRSQTTKGTSEINSTIANSNSSLTHKVLVIPFGDKMYMSEIDQNIAAETQLKQQQIRFAFQDALDEELYNKMKLKFGAVSIFADTNKYRKELVQIFSGLGYNYDKVPSQSNYVAPTSDYDRDSQIKNGNIETTVNSDARFMNAKLKDKLLLTSLNKKLGTDLFVFVNELDLKVNSGQSTDFGESRMRLAVLHYTCFNLQGKEVNSGIISVKFPKNINVPKKIVSDYISKGVTEIVKRLEASIQPPNKQGK